MSRGGGGGGKRAAGAGRGARYLRGMAATAASALGGKRPPRRQKRFSWLLFLISYSGGRAGPAQAAVVQPSPASGGVGAWPSPGVHRCSLPHGPPPAAELAVQPAEISGCHQFAMGVPRPGVGAEGVVEALAARLAPADVLPQLQQVAALAEGRAVPVPLGCLRLWGGGREVEGGGRRPEARGITWLCSGGSTGHVCTHKTKSTSAACYDAVLAGYNQFMLMINNKQLSYYYTSGFAFP